MIVPYEHVSTLEGAPVETVMEMARLAQRAEKLVRTAYRPDGINLGMNLGEAAGAGVAGHIHLHVLPRWTGDSNFMSTIGETRIIPEDLVVSWEKLRTGWE
jgi:ATP adenylyltransferase